MQINYECCNWYLLKGFSVELKNSLVTLQPGIYIIRHPGGSACALSVTRGPSGPGKHEILSTPRTQGTLLRDGSDCIVMRVFGGPIELLVTAFVSPVGGPAPTLRIDQIGLDPEPIAPLVQQDSLPSSKIIEISERGLSIIGHIQAIGDAVAGAGETIGQPGSHSRLEGFQLMWPDKPEGLDVVYGVTIEGGETTPMMTLGQYCGTRNMARRITEATFGLTGPKSNQHELQGFAHFSGGFVTPIVAGIGLSGPSGSEHLTALSLSVVPTTNPKNAKVNPWSDSARTKVFKAPSKTKPTVAQKKTPAVPTSAVSKESAKPKKKPATVKKS
jgi:hypothetical protein